MAVSSREKNACSTVNNLHFHGRNLPFAKGSSFRCLAIAVVRTTDGRGK